MACCRIVQKAANARSTKPHATDRICEPPPNGIWRHPHPDSGACTGRNQNNAFSAPLPPNRIMRLTSQIGHQHNLMILLGGGGGRIRTSDLMILLGGGGGIRLSSFYDSTGGKRTYHWVVHPCVSSIPESFEIELSVQNNAISHDFSHPFRLKM